MCEKREPIGYYIRYKLEHIFGRQYPEKVPIYAMRVVKLFMHNACGFQVLVDFWLAPWLEPIWVNIDSDRIHLTLPVQGIYDPSSVFGSPDPQDRPQRLAGSAA